MADGYGLVNPQDAISEFDGRANSHQALVVKFSLLLFLFLSLTGFWPALSNRLAYDDLFNFLQDAALRAFPHSLAELLLTPSPYPGDLYRPLTRLTYALDQYLLYKLGLGQWAVSWGLSQFLWPHLVNILLHGVVCFLIFRLFAKFWDWASALTVAVCFCVLPIHSEVVASVVGRAELLAALFLLLGLNIAFPAVAPNRDSVYARFGRPVLIGVCYLLALASKESAAVFPAIYLLLSVFFGAKFKFSTRQVATVSAVLGVMLLLFVAVRSAALMNFGNPESTVTYLENPLISMAAGPRVLKSLSLLGRYAFLSVVPISLSADYSFGQIRPEFIPQADIGYLLLLLSIVLGGLAPFFKALRLKKIPGLSLGSCGCLWFLLCFAITSNIIFPIGTIFAERLAYLPSVGICLLIAQLLGFIGYRLKVLLLVILVGIYASVSYRQSLIWRDNQALYSYQIGVSSNSAKTRMNYAVLLRDEGKFAAALQEADRAIEIWPDSAQAWYVKGTIFRKMGAAEQSSKAWLRALDLEQEHFEARLALVEYYLNQKDYGEAEKILSPLISTDGGDPRVPYAQAWILASTGRSLAALEIYKRLEQGQVGGLNLEKLKRIVTSPTPSK